MTIDFVSPAAFANFVGQHRRSDYTAHLPHIDLHSGAQLKPVAPPSHTHVLNFEVQQSTPSYNAQERPTKRTRHGPTFDTLKNSECLSRSFGRSSLPIQPVLSSRVPSPQPSTLSLQTPSDCESSLSTLSSTDTDITDYRQPPTSSLKRKASSLDCISPTIISSPSSPSSSSSSSTHTDLSCRQCSKTFCTETQLKAHCKSHNRVFLCHFPGCSTSFSKANHLTRHVRIVHNKERPFACAEKGCAARFGSKSHLRDHTEAIHLKLRSFKCDICGAAWSKRFNLQKHIRVRHMRHKPYSCSFCDMSFGTISHATRHEQAVHKRNETSN